MDGCKWRFALVDNVRVDITDVKSGQRGICPLCGAPMVAKIGCVRTPHWAHWRSRQCDDWYHPKSAWHIAWQNQFEVSWQEKPIVKGEGIKHIADIQTPAGVTVECQISKIEESERRARERFYGDMIWIVAADREGKLNFSAETIGCWTRCMELPTGEGYRLFDCNNRIFNQGWRSREKLVFFDTDPEHIDNIQEKNLVCFAPGDPLDGNIICCVVKASELIRILKTESPMSSLNEILAFYQWHCRYLALEKRKMAYDQWSPSKPVRYLPPGVVDNEKKEILAEEVVCPRPVRPSTLCPEGSRNLDELRAWQYAARHARWPRPLSS